MTAPGIQLETSKSKELIYNSESKNKSIKDVRGLKHLVKTGTQTILKNNNHLSRQGVSARAIYKLDLISHKVINQIFQNE